MNSRGLAIVSVVAIAILLVGSTAFSHSAEAKKSKTFEVKVYVKNIEKIGQKIGLHICMADDDSKCHGEKTVNLQKISNGGKKSKVLAATLNVKKLTDIGPGDVSACGKLKGFGFDTASECTYGSLQKVKAGKYKATIDYQELLDELFNSDSQIRFD